MNKVIPVEKNKDYEIYIDGFGNMGEGVGKIDNFTIFVKGAIKGEKVRIKITKVNKNFAFGRLIEVIEAAKDRTEPTCHNYKRCGGCQMQHLSYEAQLEFKKQKVVDCIERIGKINMDSVIVHDTIGMNPPHYYRNKVQLPVGEKIVNLKLDFMRREAMK